MRLELWGPRRHQRAVGFGIVESRCRMRRMSCRAEGEKPHGRQETGRSIAGKEGPGRTASPAHAQRQGFQLTCYKPTSD